MTGPFLLLERGGGEGCLKKEKKVKKKRNPSERVEERPRAAVCHSSCSGEEHIHAVDIHHMYIEDRVRITDTIL